MNEAIDRIMAQMEMRQLNIAQVVQSTPENVQEFRKALVVETGMIVKLEDDDPLKATRDENGFAELKKLSQML